MSKRTETFLGAIATTSLNPKDNAFIGGGQIGYNWQFTNWVAGLEADIQGVAHNNNTASATSGPVSVPPCCGFTFILSTTSVSREVDWLGTVRGRLGILATPSLLFYGTGGLAYGHVKAPTAVSQNDFCVFGTPNNPALTCPGTAGGVTLSATEAFAKVSAAQAKDEARRIAANIAKLPVTPRKCDGDDR
jgi:opacity protein-like surface antigen